MKNLLIITILSALGGCLAQQNCPKEGERYPDPADCHKYYECIDSFLASGACGTLYYDQAQQQCVSSSQCPQPFLCPPGITDFLPYYSECEFYIECYQGNATVMICPVNLYFDNVQKKCVQKEQSNCGEYSSSTSTWSTPSSQCLGVQPGIVVLFPYPNDCNKYIECVGNQETVYSCAPWLFFDPVRNMCNFPALVDCEGSTVSPPPTDTTIDPRCSQGNGYYGVEDCTKFLECVDGVGYILPCPPGLNFDVVRQICLDPASAVCEYTTPTPSTQSTSDPSPSCANEPNGKTFPYPGHCHLYLECVNGELTVQECPENLYYSMLLEICDYPYEAHCPWA